MLITLKDVLVGISKFKQIRIRIGNIVVFCGTIANFNRKCILGKLFSSGDNARFLQYMECTVYESHELENGIFSFRISAPEK